MNGPDKKNWYQAIEEEYESFVKNDCFEEVPINEVKPGTKIITSTWAMEKKASDRYRARLNARGFEQQEGVHCDLEQISSPVTNDATICIVLVSMIMADWVSYLCDVHGAFLMVECEEEEELLMEIPRGFENKYAQDAYLRLRKTIYGLKEAALMFWKLLLKCMRSMNYEKCWAGP